VARSVIFREEAENDLTELALYIASQSGAVVANRYLDRIYAARARPMP
jgi:plasmid stabilization system protein ParE